MEASMRALREWLSRLWSTLRPSHHDADLVDELRAHVDLAVDDARQRGMAADEAARAARLRAGSLASALDAMRDQRRLPWMADFGVDLRRAVRTLLHQPGFAATAIVSLALGIGANTAIVSVVSGVLLRPLPFPHADEIVQIAVTNASDPRLPARYVTGADLAAWRARARTVRALAAYRVTSRTLQEDGEPERLAVVETQAPLFDALATPAVFGRTLRDDDPPDAAVISARLWQRRFSSDPAVVGRRFVLDRRSFTIVGVMPSDFQFPYPRGASADLWSLDNGATTDVWVPWSRPLPDGGRVDSVVGRRQRVASVGAVRAELAAIASSVAADRRVTVVPLRDVVAGRVRLPLLVLLGASGLVLLTACANVANLLLARAAARSRETAVRAALGASRWRLVRQHVAEGLVLAGAGGAAGLLVAVAAMPPLVRLAGSYLPRAGEIGLDWRVLGVLAGVCLVAGIVFGVLPAARVDPGPGITSVGRGSTPRGRLRDGLVVAEVALAFALLVGAGLLLRTFINLRQAPAGFDATGVLTAHVAVADARESAAIEARVNAIPGVQAAGFVSLLPLQESGWSGRFAIEGREGVGSAEFRYVTPGYFRAMGIPVMRGRAFTAADRAGAAPALVVNDAFVRRYLADVEPLGHVLHDRGTIVGVIGDVRQVGLDEPAVPEIYYSIAQNFAQLSSVGSTLVVRSDVPAARLPEAIRAAVRDVNPRLAAFRIEPMTEVVAASMGDRTLYVALLGLFAFIGTAVAAAGVHAVIAYLVATRAREIGIRLALGATTVDVGRLVLGRGMTLVVAGLAAGGGLALLFTRFLQGVLFGVAAVDALTFIGVAALLALVGIVASVGPARRAARIDPAVTMRVE
jgi:predicted permease